MTPTPYPSEFYIIHRWFGGSIAAWGDIGDGPIADMAAVTDAIINSFGLEGGDEPSLATVKVWLLNDAGRRDATEDALVKCGEWLDEQYSDEPESFPPCWMAWMSAGMEAAHAATMRRWSAEDRADARYDERAA